MMLGNQFQLIFDDGSKKLAYPTGGSLWVFGGNGVKQGPGPTPDPGPSGKFVAPFSWATVTSEYGPRSGRVHQGIDFGNPPATSGADIKCAAPGKVVTATRGAVNGSSGFGNYVVVNHGVVQGQQIYTIYGHMLAPGALVNVGQDVGQGHVLGKVGNTGASFGAHLHWETHEAPPGGGISFTNPGTHRNPRDFMVKYG